ncbi:MAG: AI-2E family transporter [Gemmatimonadota bacterium]
MAPSGRRLNVVQTGRWATIGLFVLAMIAALRVGSSLIIPILMAGLLGLLLAPAVAWLVRRGLPHAVAAGLVMLAVVGAVGTTIVMLSGPATAWLEDAPKTLSQAERKIRRLTKPIEQLQATAKKMEEVAQSGTGQTRQQQRSTGQTAPGGLFQKLSGTTVSFVGALVTVIFLSYFLLATAHRFREKLDDLLPEAGHAKVTEAISEMQQQMSRYLLTVTSINVALGLVTWGVMVLNGMPNPALWGVVAGVLNFVPYLGALVTLAIILLAGLVSFDESGRAFLAAGSFFFVNFLEGNLITPTIMGRRLPLNPVAIFGGLLFWGWLWGITGAILAVPLTACLKVMADRIEPIKPVGEMLGP